MQLTEHFLLSELECKCGCVTPKEIISSLERLAAELEVFRRLGPVKVTSGYRCHAHNEVIRGAADSEHLRGNAADITIAEFSGKFLAGFAEAMISTGHLTEGGVGVYLNKPTICHYDSRGRRARWGIR